MKRKTGLILAVLIISASVFFVHAAEKGSAYNASGERDPFVPLSGSAAGRVDTGDVAHIGDVSFEGVASVGGQRVVILNGEIFRKGDKFGDIVVKDIRDDSVILSSGEKDYTIKLYE
ncbi:MAG: hypothetical protein ABH885_06065 [Candidatus Omnitrophota bacterium]